MDDQKIKKKERLASLLRDTASSFVRFEVDPNAMVTVTRVELSSDSSMVKFFVSVFPEAKEVETVKLLNKKKKEMKEFLRKETRLNILPYVEFEVDKGAKLERKIEEILK